MTVPRSRGAVARRVLRLAALRVRHSFHSQVGAGGIGQCLCSFYELRGPHGAKNKLRDGDEARWG